MAVLCCTRNAWLVINKPPSNAYTRRQSTSVIVACVCSRGLATGSRKRCKPPTPRVLMLSCQFFRSGVFFYCVKYFGHGLGSLNRLNLQFLRHYFRCAYLYLHIIGQSNATQPTPKVRAGFKGGAGGPGPRPPTKPFIFFSFVICVLHF